MLRWTGGSRRKVNTSRMSTQKRQKQYFEQRKLLEQQKKYAKTSFFQEKNASNQQDKNSRSLDIQGLLNISRVSGEHKSKVHSARDSHEGNVYTPHSQMLQFPPVIQTREAISVYPLQHKDGTFPSSQDYAACLHKASVSAPGGHEKTQYNTNDKVNPLTISTENQLSIIDLLGDDEPNSELESSTHECHVAFSIEGLGKVETSTPVHSPWVPGRCTPLSYGSSLPPRERRKALSSDYLNRGVYGIGRELDSMMVDVELPLCTSPLNKPSCSRGMTDLYSAEQKLLDTDWFSPSDNKFVDLYKFENDEFFSKRKDNSNTIWNANTSFPLNEGFHEDCDSPSKDSVYHYDADYTDFCCNQNSGMQEFNFEDCYHRSAKSFSAIDYGTQGMHFDDPYRQKKRFSMRRESEFNILDSLAPYAKHFKPENITDFSVPDGEWGSQVCLADYIDHSERTLFANEDARDNFSLFSEESSSSTAEVGDLDMQQKMNSNKRRYQDVSDVREKTQFHEKLFAKGRNYNRNDIRPGKKMHELTKLYWPLNQSSAKPAHYHSAFVEKRSDNGSSEARCDPGESSSRFSSFYQTSGSKKHVSTSFDFSTRNVLSDEEPKLHVDYQQKNLKGTIKYPCEYMPTCFMSEPMISEPDSPRYACENLFHDSKMGCGTEDSLHALRSMGRVAGNSVRDVGKGPDFLRNGDKGVDVLPFNRSHFDPKTEVSGGCNGLSSGREKSMEGSNSVSKCSNCEEPKEKTPEVEDNKYSKHAEETSSSTETSTLLKGDQGCSDEKKDTQSSLKCQAGDESTLLKGDQGCSDKKKDTQSSLKCQAGDEVTRADCRSPAEEGRITTREDLGVHQNGQVVMLGAVSFNLYMGSF